jgi:hypothetical protein
LTNFIKHRNVHVVRKDEWVAKVGQVFNTEPRIGTLKRTVWLPRDEAMGRLSDAFRREGAHVCVDGPSGVGKSSLAMTFCSRDAVRHVTVQVTASMTWAEFCRQLVSPQENAETSIGAEVELGIDKGLPTGKLKFSLGAKYRASDAELLRREAVNWTEHDVASELQEAKAALLIDDSERASHELLVRIADLAKVLTQRPRAWNVKLIVIGADDVYRRLLDSNPSLDERILQVTVGAFTARDDSWNFMKLGFEKLGLTHPGNSTDQAEVLQLFAARKDVYYAADGLPKTLNRLAQEIAINVYPSDTVKAYDINRVASRMRKENWQRYSAEYPNLVDLLRANVAVTDLVRYMYRTGVTRVHRFTEVARHLAQASVADATPFHLEAEIDTAIDLLTAAKFVTRTGRGGEIFFVRKPAAAHAFGLALSDEFALQPENPFGTSRLQ